MEILVIVPEILVHVPVLVYGLDHKRQSKPSPPNP